MIIAYNVVTGEAMICDDGEQAYWNGEEWQTLPFGEVRWLLNDGWLLGVEKHTANERQWLNRRTSEVTPRPRLEMRLADFTSRWYLDGSGHFPVISIRDFAAVGTIAIFEELWAIMPRSDEFQRL